MEKDTRDRIKNEKSKGYQNKLSYIHSYNKENYKQVIFRFRQDEEVYLDLLSSSNKCQRVRDYYEAYKKIVKMSK